MSHRFSRHAMALALLLAPAVAVAQQGEQPRSEQLRTRQPQAGNAPAPAAPAGDAQFKSFEEKLSYVLGVNTARRMQQDNITPDPAAFSRGFSDTFTKEQPLLSEQEMTDVLDQFRAQLQEQAIAAQKKLADDWDASFSQKAAGEPQKTQSGIQYEVLAQGKGKKPAETDVVVLHYVGKLQDGKVFDSSIARGRPAALPLSGADAAIVGLTEGLQLMPVGSKYRFKVPSALAYGEEGFGNAIPPNADLTFEIELLEIMPQEQPAPGTPAGDAPVEDAPAEDASRQPQE